MRLNRDLLSRIVMAAGILAGASGLSWGVTESHDAANSARADHEENRALTGAVLYVELSVGALCARDHAACPALPAWVRRDAQRISGHSG